MRWIGAAFVAAVVVSVGGALMLAAPTVAAFVAAMAQAVILLTYACGGVFVLAALVALWWWVARTRREVNRQRDGAFALREYWLDPWPRRIANSLLGRASVRVLVDVNAMMTHAALIGEFGVREVEPSGGYDRQLAYMQAIEGTRRTQSVSTDSMVAGNPLVQLQRGTMGVPNAPTARLLAGAYDRTPRPVRIVPTVDASHQLPPPAPADVSLGDGLHQGDAQNWPLGFAADGTLATFAPLRHAHAGIVGATGTGKTSSVGYLLAAHALRHGWHVVILDADNGNAWTPFARHAEHVEADAETLPDQMAALYGEFQRRARMLADRGAADMLSLPDAPPRVLAVIEEYGDLRHTMGLRDPKAAAQVDGQLDTILRRGRKAGVHVALLDQYPEHWSQQVLAGVKWLAVFRLGPNQGSKVEEYKAHQLPQRGAFLVHGTQYTAWHAAPVVAQLLATVPALPVGAGVLGGGRSTVPVAAWGGESPEVERQNAPQDGAQERNAGTADEPGRWDDVVAAWFAAHPQALTGPALGISDLARAMCLDNEGDTANYEAYKGRAHPLFHEFRKSVRLPSGDRLGTDITGSASND